MSKFCAKGHQMEDSWETCPTCQTTGYQVPGLTGAGGAAAKTRLETEGSKEAAGSPAGGAGRRTVLISEKRKPPVVGWFVAMSGDQKGEDFRLHDWEKFRWFRHRFADCLKGLHRLQPARQCSL